MSLLEAIYTRKRAEEEMIISSFAGQDFKSFLKDVIEPAIISTYLLEKTRLLKKGSKTEPSTLEFSISSLNWIKAVFSRDYFLNDANRPIFVYTIQQKIMESVTYVLLNYNSFSKGQIEFPITFYKGFSLIARREDGGTFCPKDGSMEVPNLHHYTEYFSSEVKDKTDFIFNVKLYPIPDKQSFAGIRLVK